MDTKISRLGGVYGAGDTGWNYDKLDGNGPSGLILDSDKSQILLIDMEWLGVGTVCMGFMIERKFIICHMFQHANLILGTYMTTACLPVRYEIENLGVTASASTLKQICSTVESEGGFELSGESFSAETPLLSPRVLTLADTYYPVIALRLKSTRLDSIAVLSQLALAGVGNNSLYRWKLLYNPTIVGGTWVSAGDDSCMDYNISATSLTGGQAVSTGFTISSNQSSSPTDLTKSSLLSYQFVGMDKSANKFVAFLAIIATPLAAGAFLLSWEPSNHYFNFAPEYDGYVAPRDISGVVDDTQASTVTVYCYLFLTAPYV